MQTPSTRALRERVSNRAAGLLKRPNGRSTDDAPAAAPVAAPRAPAAPPQVTLLEGLLRGEDLSTAVLTQVREWVADDDVESAISLTESLRRHPQSRELGDLASGVLAFHRGLLELAWARFSSLPRAAWASYAPEEYTRCGLETARTETVEMPPSVSSSIVHASASRGTSSSASRSRRLCTPRPAASRVRLTSAPKRARSRARRSASYSRARSRAWAHCAPKPVRKARASSSGGAGRS